MRFQTPKQRDINADELFGSNRAAILRRNYLAQLNKPFAISAIPEVFLPHIFGVTRRMRVHPVRWIAPKSVKGMRRRTDMTGKITTILAAAIVLASAGVASAQTNSHAGLNGKRPTTTSTRQICATVTQTTPFLIPMAGRGDQPP
jgi:hypothetical protein